MSRLVHFSTQTAAAVAASVAGAPRATIAVFLVATLAFASLLPSLQLVNSEDMWLPEGERTDAYHRLAQSLGATEYVGVLAQAADGNIVSATDLVRLLELERRAVSNPSVAEAFRFPRDPEANALSVADLIAEADALLADRRSTFDALGSELNATLAGSPEAFAQTRAVDHAAAVVALLEVLRSHTQKAGATPPAALLEALLPELEVALLSGTDATYKARALDLLLAATDFTLWADAQGNVSLSDPALRATRDLLLASSAGLFSNASAPMKSEMIGLLARSLSSAKTATALSPEAAARVELLLLNLSRGLAPGGGLAVEGAYLAAVAALLDALLFADQQLSVGDAEAVDGLQEMADRLAALLGDSADPLARAGAVEIHRRLFEVFVAMGPYGLDLSVPQSNVTYNAYAQALNENGTILKDPAANLSRKQQAAAELALRTYGFISTNQNLNDTGIFTDQESFRRLMTMLYFLNDTFNALVEVLGAGGAAATLDHAAVMVGAEVLQVLNTSAVPPHRMNLTLAASLEHAFASLKFAVEFGNGSAASVAFEGACAAILRAFDLRSASTLSRDEENVLVTTSQSAQRTSDALGGGEPMAVRAAVGAVAGAAFAVPIGTRSSAIDPASLRIFFGTAEREGVALDLMLLQGQNPALFARLARATLVWFTDGLDETRGNATATDSALLGPWRSTVAPLAEVLSSGALGVALKDLLISQAFGAAQQIELELRGGPPPRLPSDRAEAALRIESLGDAGVSRTLGVLVGTVVRVTNTPLTVDPADARLTAFITNANAYHASLEGEVRALLGPSALRLLPNTYEASGDRVTASGTVVLFLFNASLDRASLGARESALRDLARELGSPELSLTAFGYGLMWYDTQRAMDLSVVLFALTMLVVMGIALWAVYRRPFDVLLTLSLLACTVIWVLGTASLLRISINPITQVIPVLLIGLAEDYAVHLVVGYRRLRTQGALPNRAALAAVLGIGGVLFVATVTNGLSFLSFGGSQLALIKDFGILMALGLGYAFLMTVGLVPAAVVWRDRRQRAEPASGGRASRDPIPNGHPEGEASPSRVERALMRTVGTSVRHPWTTLLVVGLLTGACAIAATTLETTFSYDQITAKDLEVVRTLNYEQDHFPASIQRVYILVEGRVDEPAVFLEMSNVTQRALDDPFVVVVGGRSGITTAASFAEELALRIRLEGSAASGYTPAFESAFAAADGDRDGLLTAADNLTQAKVANLYTALADDPLSPASELVHRGPAGFDRAAVRVEAVRAVEHGDALTAALEQDAAPLQSGASGAAVTAVTVTGLPLLNREVMQAVQDSGWQSVVATVVLAVIILTLFFFAAFRSLTLGALTIAPTLIAVAWTLGAMVVLGLSLNMMTVMIATTTVGMGDLYAIHISYAYARALRRNKDPVRAAQGMIKEAGAPLLEAAATTALGFLILVFAPVPVVQQYGLIFAAAIVFAFLYSVVVMPILVLFHARATGSLGIEA